MKTVRAAGALSVLILSGILYAQSPGKPVPPDPNPETQTPAPGVPPSASAQETAQNFRGTIIQSKDGYDLKDPDGVTYQLDDQKRARDFLGQKVKVTGTLEASTKLIRVASISANPSRR